MVCGVKISCVGYRFRKNFIGAWPVNVSSQNRAGSRVDVAKHIPVFIVDVADGRSNTNLRRRLIYSVTFQRRGGETGRRARLGSGACNLLLQVQQKVAREMEMAHVAGRRPREAVTAATALFTIKHSRLFSVFSSHETQRFLYLYLSGRNGHACAR